MLEPKIHERYYLKLKRFGLFLNYYQSHSNILIFLTLSCSNIINIIILIQIFHI